ncbi:hypothetical protein BDC45DRAFT_532198 [Circinella umbellata]|nr:hypothetical protein BDC45DRAFT_532198 [Circinella umbellata]
MACKILRFIFVLFTIFPYYAYPYCVYNQMIDGTKIYVEQQYGQGLIASSGRFKHEIDPNGKECCPYDSKQCSRRSEKGHPVTFLLSYSKEGQVHGEVRGIKGLAGGYIIARGAYEHVVYEFFDADDNRLYAVRG